MRMKKFGRTGLVVSELCFGTMTFGGDGFWKVVGEQGQGEADALVKAAVDGGINFFDTANVYSNGQSETILGQAIDNLGLQRDQIVVATKLHGRMGPGANESGQSRAHILSAIDKSLKRLKLDYVDLYQTHGFDPVTPIEETMEALNDVVRAGKARYVGFCNLPAWKVAKANGYADKRGFARYESAQVYYTIAGRDIERELVPLAREDQLAIMPWSPLAGGLLSGKFFRDGRGPQGSRRVSFDFPLVDKDRAFDCIEAMQPIAESRGISVAQIALAWLLHQKHVTSVIIGAKTGEQLTDNLAAVTVKLTEEELATLDKVSALPREYPGWMLERQGDDRRTVITG
ncbi:1-deoxyxylulose-5-phosphate synthase YajO [Alphaproteobacteria bacterium SO-S41]|nr:1-deoxyxylulose-5-phosphate synthase YajO [Alphaproteobacteria bacterium SO-S41]